MVVKRLIVRNSIEERSVMRHFPDTPEVLMPSTRMLRLQDTKLGEYCKAVGLVLRRDLNSSARSCGCSTRRRSRRKAEQAERGTTQGGKSVPAERLSSTHHMSSCLVWVGHGLQQRITARTLARPTHRTTSSPCYVISMLPHIDVELAIVAPSNASYSTGRCS